MLSMQRMPSACTGFAFACLIWRSIPTSRCHVQLLQHVLAAGATNVNMIRVQTLCGQGDFILDLYRRHEVPAVGSPTGQQCLVRGRDVGGEVVRQQVVIGGAIEGAIIGKRVRLAVQNPGVTLSNNTLRSAMCIVRCGSQHRWKGAA